MSILGISGSLRKGASNTALLLAAKELACAFSSIEIYPSLDVLPHFNPDDDGAHPPPSVLAFRDRVSAATAILISTPEYAHGIPGVLKNALDWLVSYEDFAGKPVGVIFGGTSDSQFARAALLEVLNTMSAKVVPDAVVSISGLRAKLGSDGSLKDKEASLSVLKAVRALSEA